MINVANFSRVELHCTAARSGDAGVELLFFAVLHMYLEMELRAEAL